MTEIQFCSRCLYPSTHPLGLTFDEEGVCSGCRIHEEKDTLDWAERWDQLERLVKPYRSRGGQTYDCIVPVFGGGDSHFIVHVVKNRLGLNPLLVTYNKYFNTQLGIRNLANLRIKFNCDILIKNVGMESVKRITRASLREFGSIYWPCLAGQTLFPVETAVRYQVPLIIWGAHQGLEQVGMFSHEHCVEMTRRYRKDHDLMGVEADELVSIFDTVREEDIWQYRYPDDSDLNAVGVRGIYLGNYVRWDPKAQHERMIRDFGYATARFERTFDCYDFVDCYNYMDLHDVLKLAKHGFSKVTDHACREIRHKRLTREQGLWLVSLYERKAPIYTDLFCEWLGVTRRSLDFMIGLHRNPIYWKTDGVGEFEYAGASTLQKPSTVNDAGIGFSASDDLQRGGAAKYIVIGKGYPL